MWFLMKLRFNTCLITGGTRGIGYVIAERIAQEGLNLALVYNSETNSAINAQNSLQNKYKINVTIHKCNISHESEVVELFSAIKELHKGLQILINNAGIILTSSIENTTLDQFLNVMNVNMFGTFLMVKHSLPLLKQNANAHIINISSIAAQNGGSVSAAYAASKGAINAFTKYLAKELAPGIQVNTVAPDAVETDLLSQEKKIEIKQLNLMKSLVSPNEVAEAIIFLLKTHILTGQCISINGGRYFS